MTRAAGTAVLLRTLLLGAALAPTPAAAAEPSLAAANDWLYVLQPEADATLADMARTDFDLVVTDYSRDGSAAGEHTADQVAALKASGKVVLAYLSIGEAEAGRFYWQPSWVDDGDGDPDAPAWLGPSNPDFPDNYKVRYWDEDWQAILMGAEGAYLDRILAQGFDGVYLDIIDAFYYWSEVRPERGREAARRDMIALVEAIASYARGSRSGSGFLVVPQNGVDIVLDDDDRLDARGEGYLATIDAIGMEDLFYDELTAQDPAESAYRTAILDDYLKAGVPVLSVDYVWDDGVPSGAANVERYNAFQRAALERGYVPYAAVRDRDLDEILAVASGGGFHEPQPKPLASSSCSADSETFCLSGRRFEVRVAWRDFNGKSGSGRVVVLEVPADDSGLFYFFDADNWELLVKVLDGCAFNGHFWVFAAATTNVEYTLSVADTDYGTIRSYRNELGNLAQAITDVTAFATCP